MNSVRASEARSTESQAGTAEELIGVLTAISIVSKRLAKKLTLLEQSNEERGVADGGARRGFIPTD